jgi:hypothetical protein
MPQPQPVLATDPHLAGELRRGDPLGDPAEDQEDLDRAEMSPLPGCSREHVKDSTAGLAAVVEDRRVGVTAMDVEALAGATAGASEPFGVEQVEELLAATLGIHQIADREVHGSGSGRRFVDDHKDRRTGPDLAEKGQPPNCFHEPTF